MSLINILVKFFLNNTPKFIILCAGNIVLKGIAKLSDFKFNSDQGILYVEVLLKGEEEAIELSLENFSVITTDSGHCKLAIQHVRSNKQWLDAFFSKFIIGRWFPVPNNQAALVKKLFADNNQ